MDPAEPWMRELGDEVPVAVEHEQAVAVRDDQALLRCCDSARPADAAAWVRIVGAVPALGYPRARDDAALLEVEDADVAARLAQRGAADDRREREERPACGQDPAPTGCQSGATRPPVRAEL